MQCSRQISPSVRRMQGSNLVSKMDANFTYPWTRLLTLYHVSKQFQISGINTGLYTAVRILALLWSLFMLIEVIICRFHDRWSVTIVCFKLEITAWKQVWHRNSLQQTMAANSLSSQRYCLAASVRSLHVKLWSDKHNRLLEIWTRWVRQLFLANDSRCNAVQCLQVS
jgi:hypothetical protein